MAIRRAAQGVLPSDNRLWAALAECPQWEALLCRVKETLVDLGERFTVETAEVIVTTIDQRLVGSTQTEHERLRKWLADECPCSSPLAQWTRARLFGLLGLYGEAAGAWQEVLSVLPTVEPEGLLHRSRALMREKRWAEAAEDLRTALCHSRRYDFWARAEKPFQRLLKNFDPPNRREIKLAVLAGKATISLLASQLRMAAFRDCIAADILVGNYDNYAQDIIDPASRLYGFEADFVIVATHWRDVSLPAFVEETQPLIDDIVRQTVDLWQTLLTRHRCTILAHNHDLPSWDSYGQLTTSVAGGRGAILRQINRAMSVAAPSDVILIDLERISSEVGMAGWADPKQWYMAKQHPATPGLLPLVESHMAVIRAATGLNKKVLVLDLDNTCWGGVIGEDGLENIRLGPGSATGEAYQDFQRYLLELKQRGILLAVCSKNNEADARLPFEEHPDTVLSLGDFTTFVANWRDKAQNIRAIADTLSLGLDSFVFVDDNRVERAWIRSQLPDVAVPEMPSDPSRYVETIAVGRYFETNSISAEDRIRSDAYQSNVQREQLRHRSTGIESFLRQLAMVAAHGPFEQANMPRIAQLVNKTNQFNLTTRRYTEPQLSEQARDPEWWTRWFRLSDRFGDHGLVGVMTCKARQGEDDALEIDNWLMSCRALGRTLEHLMLRTALEHCLRNGIKKLYGRYIPTKKNVQVQELFSGFGATTLDCDAGGTEYLLDVEFLELPECQITVAVEQ